MVQTGEKQAGGRPAGMRHIVERLAEGQQAEARPAEQQAQRRPTEGQPAEERLVEGQQAEGGQFG